MTTFVDLMEAMEGSSPSEREAMCEIGPYGEPVEIDPYGEPIGEDNLDGEVYGEENNEEENGDKGWAEKEVACLLNPKEQVVAPSY